MNTTNLPEWISINDRATITRTDAIAAAGHISAAMRLLLPRCDEPTLWDLTLYRLIDCLGGDHEEMGGLANRLLDAAEAQADG